LCFKEWREKQRDEVPDSDFDDHWNNLSPKAKKVRTLLVYYNLASNPAPSIRGTEYGRRKPYVTAAAGFSFV